MKKSFIKIIILTILFVLYLYVANIFLMPKSITLIQGEELKLATMWGVKLLDKINNTNNYNVLETSSRLEDRGNNNFNIGKNDLDVNLFGSFNVSDITVNVIPKSTVIPLGDAIGLKLYTKGVLVVGKTEINGIKPYENTGIEEGDRIVSINSKNISNTEELIETVNLSKGNEMEIKYINNDNKEIITSIKAVKTSDNEFKLGLWVRDAAAGVGTATFYEPSSGMFASLGHGITDIDTGGLITIANGELVNSKIISIVKGQKGSPGEIRGSIDGQEKIGDITKNTKFGIFGKLSDSIKLGLSDKEMEVAARNEIKQGKAQIICELENGKKEYYDIEIQKIYLSNNQDNKSMLIKIVDDNLLNKTGGIIQGMSGSPIIQNGKFIGAVTHVLVNDPKQGYRGFCRYDVKTNEYNLKIE